MPDSNKAKRLQQQGLAAGLAWRKYRATSTQVDDLTRNWERLQDLVNDGLFDYVPDGFSPGDVVAFLVENFKESDFDRSWADEFWLGAVPAGTTRETIDDPDFLRGWAEGAADDDIEPSRFIAYWQARKEEAEAMFEHHKGLAVRLHGPQVLDMLPDSD